MQLTAAQFYAKLITNKLGTSIKASQGIPNGDKKGRTRRRRKKSAGFHK